MSNSPHDKVKRKPLTRMTAAELAEITKGAEKINFEDTKPLTPEMAASWEHTKRGRGRPRIGQGAEKVLISMERRLLLVTDALARRKGLDRSKLVALAIREMLEREAASKKHEPADELVGSLNFPRRDTAVPHARGRKNQFRA